MCSVNIRRSLAILSIGFALATAGCAASAQPAPAPASTVARTDPRPNVQDCGIVTISSPSKYVCNGKVYTAYQLQHLKEQYVSARAGS